MIYKDKARVTTWIEEYVFHYRKVLKQTRKDYEAGQAGVGPTLRSLSRIYSSAALLCDYLQKHMIALTGGRVPMHMVLAGSDGDLYGLGLTMDQTSILTSYVSNLGGAKFNDLAEGDEFASVIQRDFIGKALSTIANDGRGLFKVVAHHPALMRRMAAFAGKDKPIRRTFTLSIDNDAAVSAQKLYIRRHWQALPPKYLTNEYVTLRCAKVSDEAQLVAENLVEQACYTDQPVLNGLFVLFYEAQHMRTLSGSLIKKIALQIQKDCGKYKGFTGFGKEVDQKTAEAVQIAPGIVAISGAPIVSVKSALNADVQLIKGFVANKMASAEVQQLQFGMSSKNQNDGWDIKAVEWEQHMHYPAQRIELPMKKSHEILRKERAELKALKL